MGVFFPLNYDHAPIRHGKVTRFTFIRLPFPYESHANVMQKGNTCISCEKD